MLASELKRVMDGEVSNVLSKDTWYLFYVGGFVVYVSWDVYDQQWNVRVWRLDNDAWRAGCVMSSCN